MLVAALAGAREWMLFALLGANIAVGVLIALVYSLFAWRREQAGQSSG
jgi:hypothetical protein